MCNVTFHTQGWIGCKKVKAFRSRLFFLVFSSRILAEHIGYKFCYQVTIYIFGCQLFKENHLHGIFHIFQVCQQCFAFRIFRNTILFSELSVLLLLFLIKSVMVVPYLFRCASHSFHIRQSC